MTSATENIYTKNEKVYTFFSYEILFPPVNNRKFRKNIIEYQAINFLHVWLLPC